MEALLDWLDRDVSTLTFMYCLATVPIALYAATRVADIVTRRQDHILRATFKGGRNAG